MKQNPYKYDGPLDPEKDNLICISRSEDVNRVIGGIIRDEYWAILGPKQVGKTTFLRQIKSSFNNAYYHYLDFGLPFPDESDFYSWLIECLLTGIPTVNEKSMIKKWKDCRADRKFIDFLEQFTPREDKRIILLFDRIDSLPFLKNFLGLWRTVFHEKFHRKELKRYIVIVGGAVDLIAQTIGPSSPFNIAKKIFLKDLSPEESKKLIDAPFNLFGINVEDEAMAKLISHISGHPQLLQQVCYKLAEEALPSNKPITVNDVDKSIEILFETNSCLKTLRDDISNNQELEQLLADILKGKKIKYYNFKEFSMLGAGPIVERDSYCCIRNKVYEEFIRWNINSQ